jgi:regulator of sirC expression with transglutaminase-like and TPR domain
MRLNIKYKKIQALLQLLDDTDISVYRAVENELKSIDTSQIPIIENAINEIFGNSHQERFEDVISHLKYRKTEEDITNWAKSDNMSLLKGWYFASCLQYYDLEFESIEKEIQGIVKDVWLEINDSLTSLEKTSILNHILFDTYKFEIDSESPAEPRNLLINDILTTRKGNQFSISVLYHLIAKLLFLPIFPVNFDGTYLLGYYNPALSAEAFGNDASPFLFFINPGNKGAIISYKEIDYYLEKEKIEFKNHHILSKKNSIIRNLLYNLHKSYTTKGQDKRAIQANNLFKQLD